MHEGPQHRTGTRQPPLHRAPYYRCHITARAMGADLYETLMVGTLMAGGLSSIVWLLT